MTSICEFQNSTRSSRSTASTPTLMDSTMFSLKSFSRSYSRDLLLQRGVQARVLDGDADVAGQRFQQLDVFAGEEIALAGLAQAHDGDGAPLHRAGNEVVQVELRDRVLRARRLAHHGMGVVEEQVPGGHFRPLLAEEAQVEVGNLGDAERLGQAEAVGRIRRRQEDGHAVHQQRARDAVDDRTEHLVQIELRAQFAAEFDQRLAVVVTLAVEERGRASPGTTS